MLLQFHPITELGSFLHELMLCLLLEIKWLELNILGSNQKPLCGDLDDMLKEVGYGTLSMMKK
jgi:hypothetical protein